MSRTFIAIIFVAAGLIARPVLAQKITNIQVIAPAFAPLQMMVDEKPQGYVVDLARELVNMVSDKGGIRATEVKIFPWRRAIKMATAKPNVLMFSISRTKKRESQYEWVGEVSPYEIYFFKLAKHRDISLKSLTDLGGSSLRVGVQASSNTEELLIRQGLKKGSNYVTYSHFRLGIKMLFNNRFAMLPLTSFVARANICRQGYAADQIEPVIRVDSLSKPLWMVFSQGTDGKIVERFQNALAELKRIGVDKRLRDSYLKDWQRTNCAPIN